MSENLSLALQLLLVGMLTVFIILGLVVVLGRSLIVLVNHYSTEEPLPGQKNEMVSRKKLAILSSAVEVITKGKGVIHSVKKIE